MGQTPCQPSTVNNGEIGIDRQIKIGRGIDCDQGPMDANRLDTWTLGGAIRKIDRA